MSSLNMLQGRPPTLRWINKAERAAYGLFLMQVRTPA
jgi:hypothetical protein